MRLDYRTAHEDEMDVIYLMGFDAWADGQDVQRYLSGCRNSPK